MDPLRRERRLITSGWLLVAGVVLLLLGLWVSTLEMNWHLGSVWHYINQVEMTTERWSAAAIRANQEVLVVAAVLALAGLTSLVVGIVVLVRTLRRHDRGAREGGRVS